MVRKEVADWYRDGGEQPELYPEEWAIVEINPKSALPDCECQIVETVDGMRLIIREQVARSLGFEFSKTFRRIGVTFKPLTIDGETQHYSETVKLTGWATGLARLGVAPLVVSINGKSGLFVPSDKVEVAWQHVLDDVDLGQNAVWT